MKATGWGLCATALLTAALTGCPGADMFTQKPTAQAGPVEQHFLAARVDVAAERVQGNLRQLGIDAVATPEGEGVRLKCTTAAGQHFAVVLTRSPMNDAGTFTDVRVEWEDAADSVLTRQILLGLEVLLGS
jgi:hypothetical protein